MGKDSEQKKSVIIGKDSEKKVHETKSETHDSGDHEEDKSDKGKQIAEEVQSGKEMEKPAEEEDIQELEPKNKKAKVEGGNAESSGSQNKAAADKFDEFCKVMRRHLSIQEMRRILETNQQDPLGSDDAVVPRCQDVLFFGPLEKCPICGGQMEPGTSNYSCNGYFSEWSYCVYTAIDPARKDEPIKLPGVSNVTLKEMLKSQMSGIYPRHKYASDIPLSGMTICLAGRLSRRHQVWKDEIKKHGGEVSRSVNRADCLIVSAAERQRGGSSKVAEALELEIPVVSEAWLIETLNKKAVQPLEAYDVLSDHAPEGKEIPLNKLDPSEEAIRAITAELKIYGKRGVYKDSRLQEHGGIIYEKDGIIYNCALAMCDRDKHPIWGLNEYCIIQLISLPRNKNLHLYYKRSGGGGGDIAGADERLEEWDDDDSAEYELARLFEEISGNDFKRWERKKKFHKKFLKFYPIDMDVGFDVRYGGLGLRQLGAAAAHCRLEPHLANLMKVLCSQEIYRYALMEMGYDSPDLPIAMLTDYHMQTCEKDLIETMDKLRLTDEERETDPRSKMMWLDFSNKWFTMMRTTRPFVMTNFQEIADNVAAGYETIRDINVASRLIEDMSGATVEDTLTDLYQKLNCAISAVDKESDDYKMVVKYLQTTYEPFEVEDVSYGVSVENIFAIDFSAGPSYDDIKNLPNKILLWSGTRTSNILRHMHRGILPAVCRIPVPGYMFGKAVVCSDASAEAARYGFTAVDRPEGFLVVSIVSLGKQIVEISKVPDDTKEWEEGKIGVKGLGKKQPEESQHFIWKDDIKVPCGQLVDSMYKESPLEYNEYAVY